MNTKKYLIRGALTIGILAFGVIVLQWAGGGAISELTQDVSITRYEDTKAEPNLGKQAPYFELSNLRGNRVRLSDFLGTPVIILFWASWNQSAADQLKIVDDYYASHKDGAFTIIAINTQEDKSVAASFMKRGGYEVPTILDSKGAVGETYHIQNLPTIYFIDRSGIVRGIFVGVMNQSQLVDNSEKIIK